MYAIWVNIDSWYNLKQNIQLQIRFGLVYLMVYQTLMAYLMQNFDSFVNLIIKCDYIFNVPLQSIL